MKTEDITREELFNEIDSLKQELTIYNKDILYMGKHREAIALDDNIAGEFKHPILLCIDEEIASLASICRGMEEEIKHYEQLLCQDIRSSLEDTAI